MSNHEEVLHTQDVGGQFNVVGKLVHDPDPECPVKLNDEKSDHDCNGAIYRFERNNHLQNQNYHHIYENDPFALKLSKFEHGDVVWSLSGEGPQCTFDTTQHAGYWVCEGGARENYNAVLAEKGPEEAQKWLRECGRLVLDEFTSWCNGDCWGVVVEVTPLDEDAEEAHAVWGYLGRKDAEAELKAEFDGVVKFCEEKLATRRERALALIEDEDPGAWDLDDEPLGRYFALFTGMGTVSRSTPEACLKHVNASGQDLMRFVDLDGQDNTCGVPVPFTKGYTLQEVAW